VIQGDVTVTNTAIATVTLDGIEEIRGGLDVRDNPNLVTLAPRDLRIVSRLFTVTNNPLLELATFPFLGCMAGGGPIFGNNAMRTLDFPVLRHLQTLEVRDNTSLSGVNLPFVETLGMTQPNPGRLIWAPREVTFYRLPALEALALPTLTEGNARFTLEETGATALSLPEMTRVEGIYVGNNPALQSFDVSSLTSLSALPGWCPRQPGSSLSDPCTPVYYIVDNLLGLTSQAAETLEAACIADGVPEDPAVLVDDAATRYECDLDLCECVLD